MTDKGPTPNGLSESGKSAETTKKSSTKTGKVFEFPVHEVMAVKEAPVFVDGEQHEVREYITSILAELCLLAHTTKQDDISSFLRLSYQAITNSDIDEHFLDTL